jgi:hypothetical protein
MIDPWEAAILFLLSRSELNMLNGQIGRIYDGQWQRGTPSLAFVMDDSSPDEAPVHVMRFESRCYANDVASAMDTWMALMTISRTISRVPVAVTGGTCLIYDFEKMSGPSRIPDQDLNLEMITGFWNINISEVTA